MIETAKDRLCLKEFELNEDAINTVSTMMGFTITDLIAEEESDNPNEQKIETLKKTLRLIGRERQEVYSGNDKMKHSVIERYMPYIRKRIVNEHFE
jgi:hypothetical protein